MILKRYICFCVVSLLMMNFCLAKDEVDSLTAKKVHNMLVRSHRLIYSNIDSASIFCEQVLEISESKNYQKGFAGAYNLLGIIYDIKGDFAKSFSYHKKSSDFYANIGHKKGVANAQSNMALLLKFEKRFGEALSYISEASKFYKESADSMKYGSSLITIGNLLVEEGHDLDTVLNTIKEAEIILRIVNDTTKICSALNAQAEVYQKFGKVRESIEYYNKAVFLADKARIPFNLGYSYLGLSKVYLGSNQLELAKQSNQAGLLEYEKLNYKFGLMELHETAIDIYEKQGDLKNSLASFRIFFKLKESLFNEEKSKQIAQVKTQYETEKKDQKIELLSQQASIQTLEIKQKNQGIIIGFVSFLFLISGAYFIYRQRLSKSQKTQVEIEQRFLRSQLNPHFISNALVAVQNYLLKNKPEIAAIYLGKFSKLMREILENSRKEFILVADEVEMLTNYLEIHKLRLNSSFDYKITIDENIDSEMETIPPMFVQPFVENAIEHGIINKEGEGLIEVHLIKEDEYISIEIKDNGSGIIQNSQSKKDKSHNSLSSTIIQERIGLFNRSLKNKIKLVIDDIKTEGMTKGTKVALKVPYSYI